MFKKYFQEKRAIINSNTLENLRFLSLLIRPIFSDILLQTKRKNHSLWIQQIWSSCCISWKTCFKTTYKSNNFIWQHWFVIFQGK